jgi:hypothetical protein
MAVVMDFVFGNHFYFDPQTVSFVARHFSQVLFDNEVFFYLFYPSEYQASVKIVRK